MANLTATTITGNLDVTGGGVISGDGSGLSGVDAFEANTSMIFNQASAPTGWTKQTGAALANTVMSIVTGTGGGTGGSTSYFSSFLATTNKSAPAQPTTGSVTGTVGGHTLSTPEIASHSHDIRPLVNGGSTGDRFIHYRNGDAPGPVPPVLNSTNTGGGGSHSHPFSGSLGSASTDVTIPAANVQYANVIVANKD